MMTTVLGRPVRLAAPLRAAISALEPQLISNVSSLALGDPSVIPLWFGESDVATPEFIRRTAKEALDKGETFYTHTRGILPLRKAIADYSTALYRRPVGVERVSVTTAGMNAIMLMMELSLEAGDNAVMVTPLWPNAGAAARIMGAEVLEVSLAEEQGRWRLDLDRLFAACDARTRLIFVNSPGNPTGWMMSREEQQAVLDFCRRRRIWLAADEVYARIVYQGNAAPSFLDIAEPDDPLLVANSFSKAWAMTGWRIGWLTAPAALGDLIGELVQHNVSGVATFLQPAAITALKEGEPFVKEMVERCRRGRDIVAEHLAEIPRVRFTPPEAAFYAFFQVEGADDTLALAKRLVRDAGVGVAPGAAFGTGGEGFLRLCFAQAPELLATAMERLKRALG